MQDHLDLRALREEERVRRDNAQGPYGHSHPGPGQGLQFSYSYPSPTQLGDHKDNFELVEHAGLGVDGGDVADEPGRWEGEHAGAGAQVQDAPGAVEGEP